MLQALHSTATGVCSAYSACSALQSALSLLMLKIVLDINFWKNIQDPFLNGVTQASRQPSLGIFYIYSTSLL